MSGTSILLSLLGLVSLAASFARAKDGSTMAGGSKTATIILGLALFVLARHYSTDGASTTTGRVADATITPHIAAPAVSPPASPPKVAPSPPKAAQVITFSNVQVKTDFTGSAAAIGEATNNQGVVHTFTLKVSFYDQQGKLLGTASGIMNDLGPGETKTWDTMSMDKVPLSDINSWKVQVDTMIQ